MSSQLRIVFMGTPDFATESLKRLVENDFNVVGVVTAPDRPAGRGQKISENRKWLRRDPLSSERPTILVWLLGFSLCKFWVFVFYLGEIYF